jgi:hypothetical protein
LFKKANHDEVVRMPLPPACKQLFRTSPRRSAPTWNRSLDFSASRTRDASSAFGGYMRGLFRSERANMLRMSEVNAIDPQAMQHMLTDGAVDWDGFADAVY